MSWIRGTQKPTSAERGGRQDLRELGRIRGHRGRNIPASLNRKRIYPLKTPFNIQNDAANDSSAYSNYQCWFWNRFPEDLKNECVSVSHPSPAPPPNKPGGICSSSPPFLSWSIADSPFFVHTVLPGLPMGILINFYAVIGFFFLPHLHCLVLHHVEGNYTFIYYMASNIKPRKLYQRQQLFNHPSR